MHLKTAARSPFWALILALLAAGAVGAQTPNSAKTSQNADAVGDDVQDAAQRWLGGDKSGRRILEKLASSGRADAQEMLAEVLESKNSVQAPEPELACRYHLQASSSRADAMHNLAFCAERGVGGPKDFRRAAEFYGLAAEKGFGKSMCALGNFYIAGKGVQKDVQRGVDLCRKGAEAGDRDAQTDMGNFYMSGSGVPQDVVQGRHWYEKAAEQGQANAEFVLGQIYWHGDGVDADQTKAASLLAAAFQDGRSDAASLLGQWNFVRWMAAHRAGDLTLLNEAIQWDEAALKLAPDRAARDEAQADLKMARAFKEATIKGEK